MHFNKIFPPFFQLPFFKKSIYHLSIYLFIPLFAGKAKKTDNFNSFHFNLSVKMACQIYPKESQILYICTFLPPSLPIFFFCHGSKQYFIIIIIHFFPCPPAWYWNSIQTALDKNFRHQWRTKLFPLFYSMFSFFYYIYIFLFTLSRHVFVIIIKSEYKLNSTQLYSSRCIVFICMCFYYCYYYYYYCYFLWFFLGYLVCLCDLIN